jgi:primosomal protein N' (replication factor Y)
MDASADPPPTPARAAQVLIPLPLSEPYDYLVPENMELEAGDIVAVPLGPRTVTGVVVGLRAASGSNRRLREVAARLDIPAMPPGAVEFVRWAAHYAVAAPGAALGLALRGHAASAPKVKPTYVAARVAADAASPARARVLAAAREPKTRAQIAREAGVSSGVVSAMVLCGALVPGEPEVQPRPACPGPAATLSPGQAAALEALAPPGLEATFGVSLLDGVTGSGKTEVYLEAAARTLIAEPDAQVLVLLPEIALTGAILDRFAQRFGAQPLAWHSAMPPGRRGETWRALAQGSGGVVVGARSALFLPFRRLRLIVVDEEHDAAFKQDEGFIYQARDLAVARAKIEGARVILASATPSLETVWNARTGRYRHIRLEGRHGTAQLPRVELTDLRRNPPPPGEWLSAPLTEAMAEALARGEQSLLFLNRRGYAPLVICRACGEKMRSPDTDSWLVEHRYSGRLVCHLTGFSMPWPERCPLCAASGSLISIGPGVERIAEEARRKFPDARLVVFSSDTAPNAKAAREIIDAMAEGFYDIMVATQSAAKGHNFPSLTLVGVVDADVGLRGGDLRAAERTFQLLTQVAGRAGRADRVGRALIQTWAPEHPVMQALAAQDREGFFDLELAEREALGLPPFGRLAALVLSSEHKPVLDAYAAALAAAAPLADGVAVYGPADAPLALIRGRRRKRFLVRAERAVDIQAFVGAWLARAKPPARVRVVVDVDPYAFI